MSQSLECVLGGINQSQKSVVRDDGPKLNKENAWSLSQSGMFKDVCMDMSPNNLLSIEQIYELQHHLHWYENFNYYELITTLQILF